MRYLVLDKNGKPLYYSSNLKRAMQQAKRLSLLDTQNVATSKWVIDRYKLIIVEAYYKGSSYDKAGLAVLNIKHEKLVTKGY